MDQPGNQPGIKGKLPVKHLAGGLTGFLSLSFLSLVDALFLLCPWFSHEVFYTVMSFNEASEDTGFYCFCFFSQQLFVALLAVSFSPLLHSFASSVRGEVSE